MYSIVNLFLLITHIIFVFGDIGFFCHIVIISNSPLIPYVLIVTVSSIILFNITNMCHN